MELVSWNCQNGLTEEKADAILKEYPDADIFAIQECRRTDIDAFKIDWKYKNWYGDDQDKNSDLGLAVFSKNYKMEYTDFFNRNFRYVVPYKVIVNNKALFLLNIWTKSIMGGAFDYDENVTQAVSYYKDLLNADTIIIGDYNTFAKQDNGRLEELENNMNPLINCTKNTKFRETVTFYHNEANGFGINDFCFASENLFANMKAIKIETHEKNRWRNLSDHCPIMVEVNF